MKHIYAFKSAILTGNKWIIEKVQLMNNYEPNLFFLLCWKYIAPLSMIVSSSMLLSVNFKTSSLYSILKIGILKVNCTLSLGWINHLFIIEVTSLKWLIYLRTLSSSMSQQQ